MLTGGACGGKTTGQARLCTFFENLGWKVLRVPETASVLLPGGIKFADLNKDQAYKFQENLLKTMLQIENTFFEVAKSHGDRNCLVICDRGAMDSSVYITKEQWEFMIKTNGWNNVELRDTRYDHIIHMVSAANGAEAFYTIENHSCRSDSIDEARYYDHKAALAWVGHPYFDVIDNSQNFDSKIRRLIDCVCQKLGIDPRDRLSDNSRKVKFLVRGPLVDFPCNYQDFDVVHDYLQSGNPMTQARLRKRGQNGHWSYIHTLRRPKIKGQAVEVKTQLTHRDYLNALGQRDDSHFTIYKRRRCFLVKNQYFQLDIYQEPGHPRCKGLMLLETYTSLASEELRKIMPKFLKVEREVTGVPEFSMFNLSLKEEWNSSDKYCSDYNDVVTIDDDDVSR